jgi:pyochelin synthetase
LAERELGNGDRYEHDRSYWLGRINKLPPPPELPVQETRSEVTRLERHEVTLPASHWEALRRRAAHHGLRAAGVVLAAYAEVIGTWSRRPRFTLCVTGPSRLQDIDHLAGDVPTVTLLVVDQSRPEPFAIRAQALGVQLARDLDHRRFSGVEVMQEIGRRRGGGSALMPVVFTGTLAADPGQVGEVDSGSPQAPHTWIDCHPVDRDGGLVVEVDARAGVFPDGLVPDMVQALHRLLIDLASSADAWASPYPVDLPAGQRACREEVNATAAPVLELLLHNRVCAQASATPERTALVWPGG